MLNQKQKTWRLIGIGCLVAAACIMAIWWPHFTEPTRRWAWGTAGATTARATALGLVLIGAVILASATGRRSGE
jgi:hypothetical protein